MQATNAQRANRPTITPNTIRYINYHEVPFHYLKHYFDQKMLMTSNHGLCSTHYLQIQRCDCISDIRLVIQNIIQISSKRKSMENKAKVYSFLKNTPKNITISPINMNNIKTKSPISNYGYLTSNNSPNRSKSPAGHLKTKIRLVSPQRLLTNSVFTPKENTPPAEKLSKSHKYSEQCHSPQLIELGGKTAHFVDVSPKNEGNQTSNVSIMNHAHPSSHPSSKKENIVHQRFIQYVPQQFQNKQAILSPRQTSPQKICFNNKTFDVGAIRSQIVYVNPHCQRREIQSQYTHYEPIKRIQKVSQAIGRSCSPSSKNNQVSHVWPSELVIQQENNLEELKQSYESQLKQIKQLQQEIHQNNIQIKELLKSSRVSKHTHTSKHTADAQQFCQSVQIFTNQLNPASSQPNFRPAQVVVMKKYSQSSEESSENGQKASYNPASSPKCSVANKRQTAAINSQQSLINELNCMTSHRMDKASQIKRSKDEASVQTEQNGHSLFQQSSLSKNDSKYQRLTLARNIECQIQMVMCSPTCKPTSTNKLVEKIVHKSNAKQQHKKEEQQKGLNLYSQPSLVYLFKSQEQIVEKEMAPQAAVKVESLKKTDSRQKIIEEIIPVSQQSISSVRAQNTEFKLKEASSECSIPQQSSPACPSKKEVTAIKLQQRQIQNISDKDNRSVNVIPEPPRITEVQEAKIQDVIRNKISEAKIPSVKNIQADSQQKSSSKLPREQTPIASGAVATTVPIPAAASRAEDPLPAQGEAKSHSRKFSNRIYL